MMKTVVLLLGFVIMAVNLQAQSAWDNLRSLSKQKDFVQAENFINDAVKERPKDKDVFLLAGKVYLELDKIDKTLEMFQKAYAIDDEDPQVISRLGLAYAKLNKFEEAMELLKEANDDNPNNLYIQLALGETYIAQNDMDQAALWITKARENNKNEPLPYIALGDLYFAQNVYELAKNNYEEALKLDDTYTEGRIKLAIAYYWMANREYDRDLSNELFNRSLKEWNVITQKEPKYSRAWWEQGRILFFGKRWDQAAGSFVKYLDLRPDHSLARWYLAQSYVEIGLCDSAAPHLRQVAAELDSVKNKAGLMLAQCLFQQNMYQQSLDEYEAVKASGKVEMDIQDIERMAAAALKAGDTSKTILYYKEVIQLDPTKCNTMYQLANLTIYMKDYDNAIFFLNTRNNNCQDSMLSKVYYLLGTCYFSKEMPDTAEVILNKALDLDSNNLQARIYLADVMAGLGKKDEALATFNASLQIALSDTALYSREILQAYSKQSNLLLDMKKFTELNKLTKEWLEYDPQSTYAWLYNGISWQGLADKNNACRSYKKGLAISPDNNFLKKQIKALECN